MFENVFETVNSGFAQALYEDFLRDPSSAPTEWRVLFESGVKGESPNGGKGGAGAGVPDVATRQEFTLPEKPSIAVFPFVNMSDDPKQEYFSDGITEEIITWLSKIPRLFVTARNSAFTFKGKQVRVREVGQQLGVRYIMEGSVRKSGDRVRVTAQLIDVNSEQHVWADRYDRELKDIFAVQDEITMNIVVALQVQLTEGDQARLRASGTENLEAYLKLLQAREYFHQMSKEGNILSRQKALEAVASAPDYASAYAGISWTYLLETWLGWSDFPRQSIALAMEYGFESCQEAR